MFKAKSTKFEELESLEHLMDSHVEPILRENPTRFTLFPIQKPKLFQKYKNHVAVFWTVEEIDLAKSIHKLTGKELTTYFLRDGFEGQVIYILPFGDDTNLSNIKITVLYGTYWHSNLLVTSDRIRPLIWTPFSDKLPSNTMATAIFTEGKWFLNGGTSVQER
jgi:hypothetical protein